MARLTFTWLSGENGPEEIQVEVRTLGGSIDETKGLLHDGYQLDMHESKKFE